MNSVLLLLVIILLRNNPARSNLTVIPSNTVVLVGDSTAIGCNSSIIFTCSHTPLGGKDAQYFYKDQDISPGYRQLGFSTKTKTEFGERNFVVENVTTAKAGKYECEDIDDHKESAEVIVLEEPPKCSASMGESVGSNNEIRLSCSATYRGNEPPELKWTKFDESEVLKSNCTTENGGSIKTCNLNIEPDLILNGSVFVCQTTQKASVEQYNCTTKAISILRYFSSKETQRTAVPEATPQSKQKNDTESPPELLKLKEFMAAQESAFEKENKQWTPAIIGLLILGVLPYVAFGCYLFTRMRRGRSFAKESISLVKNSGVK